MRYRAMLICALCVLLLTTGPVAKSEERGEVLTDIPVEFRGRWVMSVDHCVDPAAGELYIQDRRLEFFEGLALVVSARRTGDLKLEVDLSMTSKSRVNQRQLRLFALSQDSRTLTETRTDSTRIVRVRCD